MGDERDEDAPEGWHVRQRPAMIGAVLVPLGLLLALLAAGTFYERDLHPKIDQHVTTFPAPGIETFVHDGVDDPPRPRVRTSADTSVVAATHAVVAEGLPGWSRR